MMGAGGYFVLLPTETYQRPVQRYIADPVRRTV